MGVVNLSEIGLHLKQHSLTALPGTRTPNMLYGNRSSEVSSFFCSCFFIPALYLLTDDCFACIFEQLPQRCIQQASLGDCRSNASSTSRRSSLSSKSLYVELMLVIYYNNIVQMNDNWNHVEPDMRGRSVTTAGTIAGNRMQFVYSPELSKRTSTIF
ncbi:hypothetical protein T11_16950 [Trichinella zimbabwensis]|uniref:Uncharacterized protein n=1 Tax=Trichinella zimbabwensis TaxID=268475 RepID=A0A0V1HDN2_9BILA|nr:hypothetical protein T11_16950 [Trichinella zimbabwensis]